jgi:PD-(D/E)XK nuclease superfamily
MKLTNKHGLPETILNVLKRPQYSKGKANLSVTELMTSPRIVQLKRRHWDELEEDSSDMVWSIFGTAIHNILEHGKDENHIVEERIHIQIGGMNISGAIDLQEVHEDGVVLSDYKTVGAWSVMNEKQDWHNQLNCYAYLLHKAKGVTVKKLQIVAIVRDWARRDTTREGYPKAPIVVIDIPLWPVERQEAYIKQRIHLQESAFFDIEVGSDVAECTPEEMWERPTFYALKKEGNVRAKSVHETPEAADQALALATEKAKKGEKFIVEIRPGDRVRCSNFCQVSEFCNQYKAYLSTKPTQGEI